MHRSMLLRWFASEIDFVLADDVSGLLIWNELSNVLGLKRHRMRSHAF